MNKFPDIKALPEKGNDVIFYPEINLNESMFNLRETLSSRWIGEGEKVIKFEHAFKSHYKLQGYPVAVNSGTSALHLAYLLAGIQPGDEVIVPVFTCTATNIPLLWIGAKIVFADVNNDLNINFYDVARKITRKTKAIVCVHYGGVPCDMLELKQVADSFGIPIIEDAAQCLGGKYRGEMIGNISDYTCFSFQAVKQLTTGDGGMLVVKDKQKAEKAKRLRWFGIDRKAKQNGIWENDITEIGYKYQMTNIDASIGLAGLKIVDKVLNYRKELFELYAENLKYVDLLGSTSIGRENACWLATILTDANRDKLIQKLSSEHIESGVIHYRNDQYSIFGGKQKFTNMDELENKYLVLPLHTKLTKPDVVRISNAVNKWT